MAVLVEQRPKKASSLAWKQKCDDDDGYYDEDDEEANYGGRRHQRRDLKDSNHRAAMKETSKKRKSTSEQFEWLKYVILFFSVIYTLYKTTNRDNRPSNDNSERVVEVEKARLEEGDELQEDTPDPYPIDAPNIPQIDETLLQSFLSDDGRGASTALDGIENTTESSHGSSHASHERGLAMASETVMGSRTLSIEGPSLDNEGRATTEEAIAYIRRWILRWFPSDTFISGLPDEELIGLSSTDSGELLLPDPREPAADPTKEHQRSKYKQRPDSFPEGYNKAGKD